MLGPQVPVPLLCSRSTLPKVLALKALMVQVDRLRQEKQKIVFTNGCFDLLHPGHIQHLDRARHMGDVLIVGVNSDHSVRRLKGPLRPIMNQDERVLLLSALDSIDFITVFDEDTPHRLISSILPDMLVKGGDWQLGEIVGREEVEAAGGSAISLPYNEGQSTTAIVDRILRRYGHQF